MHITVHANYPANAHPFASHERMWGGGEIRVREIKRVAFDKPSITKGKS